MRITCPSCDASYEIQATALRPGRKVKCARCGDSWVPAPPAPPQAPAPAPADTAAMGADDGSGHDSPRHDIEDGPVLRGHESETPPPPEAPHGPSAMDLLAAAPPPAVLATNPWPLRGAWIASAAVVLAGVLAVSLWAQPIARAWPPSQRILGVPPPVDTPPETPAPPARGH